MDFIKKYGGASDGTGPSPVVWNKIPTGTIACNPADGHGFFTRFINDGVSHASTGTTVPGWICNYVANAGTIAPANVEGGGIVLTPDSTENDGMQIQTGEAFVADSDTCLAFGARVALSDADQNDIFVGLATLDTDLAQSNPNDVIGFTVADASANILYKVDTDGTATATDTGSDASDATYVRLEALVDNESKVRFYVDGVLKATVTSGIPTDEPLGLGLAVVTGEGAANTMSVSWAYAYQWRCVK